MKIAIVAADGTRHRPRRPHPQADHVVLEVCPSCSAAPCEVRGSGVSHHDHDTYYARAIARCCGADVGELRATVSTLFGIDEDRAVLDGRPRVY